MSVLVGNKAPNFTAAAVLGTGEIVENFSLSSSINGKYGLLFFYPLDFTFVCPSELIALNNKLSEFKERNVEVITVSIDSQFTHFAWRGTEISRGGIGPVGYTMVSDLTHNISRDYGIIHPEANVSMRASFIINKDGIVMTQSVNNLPIGRSIDELIRQIDAIQFHEANGEVCPVNWQKGKAAMTATSDGVAEYLSQHAEEL